MSAFPAGAPGVLEAPLQRLLAALLAGSETGQVIAGMSFSKGFCCRILGIMRLHPEHAVLGKCLYVKSEAKAGSMQSAS